MDGRCGHDRHGFRGNGRVHVFFCNVHKIGFAYQEGVDHSGVKMGSGFLDQHLAHLVVRKAPLVNPLADQCVVDIGQRHQSTSQWNRVPGEAVRIAFAIPALMVRFHHLAGVVEKILRPCVTGAVNDFGQSLCANQRMRLHDGVFVGRQFARFLQNAVGNTHFANVVQRR